MDYYSHIAQGYDKLHREEQEKKLKIIKGNLKANKDDLLLDVGCGTGISSGFGCKVIGVDPSKGMIKKAQKKIKAICAPAEKLPFEDKKFDIVIAVTAIQNFSDIKKGSILQCTLQRYKKGFQR